MNYIDEIGYCKIYDFKYERLFEEVEYNGNVLNDLEREKFVKILDDTISQYLEGIPIHNGSLDMYKCRNDEFSKAYMIYLEVSMFVLMTSVDSLIISKYFLLADKDYDKRFMRGKMKVIINEGFKKLYGFNEKSKNESQWKKLSTIIKYLPQNLKDQYRQLSDLLVKHSQSSSWWKNERNVETHLDANKLYDSRSEEVIESKVMMESSKLFNTFYAVNCFLRNVHTYFYNTIVDILKQSQKTSEN